VVAEESGHEPRHLVVEEAGVPRAILPAYLGRVEPYGDLHHRWLGPARDLTSSVGVCLRPALVAAPPLSTVSEPLGDLEGLPERDLEELFGILEETAWSADAVAVVLPFLDPDSERLLATARKRGYVTAFESSRAVLRVRWRTVEEYVASLGRSSGRTARKELEALRSDGFERTSTVDFRSGAAEMDRLYRRFFRSRNDRKPPLASDFFTRLATEPAEGVRAQLVRRGGRLVAASVMLEAGATMDGTLGAYTDDALGSSVYYDDLVYAPVRRAVQAGIRRIDLGPGSLYPKLLRGAELRPRITAVRGRTRAHRAAIGVLARAVSARNRQKEERAVGELAG